MSSPSLTPSRSPKKTRFLKLSACYFFHLKLLIYTWCTLRFPYSKWYCSKYLWGKNISLTPVDMFDEACFFNIAFSNKVILFPQSMSLIQILDEKDCLSTITQWNFPPLRWGSVKLGEKMIRGHFNPWLLRKGYCNNFFRGI